MKRGRRKLEGSQYWQIEFLYSEHECRCATIPSFTETTRTQSYANTHGSRSNSYKKLTCSFCRNACPRKIASSTEESSSTAPISLLLLLLLLLAPALVGDTGSAPPLLPDMFFQVFLMRSSDGSRAILWFAYLVHRVSYTRQKCSYLRHTSHLHINNSSSSKNTAVCQCKYQ